ncbi:MAG: TonB-dependent receptor, partial [Prolixibacteraceae bacterium]|nr:TonB-dependent receptor [Prolixibacteraceae bacterium]
GKVTDSEGRNLEHVHIWLKNTSIGTTTNRQGEYLLRIPSQREVTLVYSLLGWVGVEKTVAASPEERIIIDIVLEAELQQIDPVNVISTRRNMEGATHINPKLTTSIASAGGNDVEALIKTLPGVSSNNEMSSQYSVRGGNFDENLVYVNDVEIYRPLLIRSGQQEGLSFINGDLVSSIEFSTGGFSARYGDKMSSVLDIKYRRPTGFRGSASGSLLGGSVHLEDRLFKGKLTHITGVRYKSNTYLLNTLDEKGDYDPRFFDIQTYITWQPSEKFDLSFMGNIAQNSYLFIPKTRETSFGTWNMVRTAKIYFGGSEVDKFNTRQGALIANYHPHNRLNLKLITMAYSASEYESYDILGQYRLAELEGDTPTETDDDSIVNPNDIASFLNHARNQLKANVYTASHKGAWNGNNHLINWSINFNHEQIDSKINEWIYRDSTGYSLPHSDSKIQLYYTLNSKAKFNSNRLSGHIQDTWNIPIPKGNMYLTAGIRANYWDFNNELVASPRFLVNYFPEWERNFSFKLSLGAYHQPAFFKELIGPSGKIWDKNKAQRSYQALAGVDYIFTAWNRPFRFTSEAYYKYMSHLVPYQIDNVRIRYLPELRSKGYATGLDLKINGEFVSGLQSWASISIMQTKEDIDGDGHGYIPRPVNQLINFSLYFQDYLPGNPTWKMHLAGFYGSRLPVGPPNSEPWQNVFRIPPYRRIDLGISKVLISEERKFKAKFLNPINDMWLSLEIFNLLGINNTISYFWVSGINGYMYGVPNYLTSRKINLKLSLTF